MIHPEGYFCPRAVGGMFEAAERSRKVFERCVEKNWNGWKVSERGGKILEQREAPTNGVGMFVALRSAAERNGKISELHGAPRIGVEKNWNGAKCRGH